MMIVRVRVANVGDGPSLSGRLAVAATEARWTAEGALPSLRPGDGADVLAAAPIDHSFRGGTFLFVALAVPRDGPRFLGRGRLTIPPLVATPAEQLAPTSAGAPAFDRDRRSIRATGPSVARMLAGRPRGSR